MKILVLAFFFISCAGLPTIQNPAVAVGAGAVGGEVVKKAVDSIPKFSPYFQIKDFEVCIQDPEDPTLIDCTLVLSHEKRKLSKDRLNEGDSIFIKQESFLYLLSEIQTYCKAVPEDCKKEAKKYKSIKRAFIF